MTFIYWNININIKIMNNKSPEKNIHNSSLDTVESILTLKKRKSEEKEKNKNNISIIWDELKLLLDNDEDFKIEKIERNNIIIKALRKEAFHNILIMGKIIGRILPSNCKIEIHIKNYRDRDPNKDQILYDFSIKSDEELFYNGVIYIIR